MEELKVLNEQIVLDKEFKIYGDIDNPLFLAKDVANWIEHSDTSKMIRNVDEDEKVKNIVPTLGGNQEMWFLTEDGLYEVLMQSRKPIAKAFKKKVKEILKGLRKGELELHKLNKKQELQLSILNGSDMERVVSLKEYENLVVEEATRPLITKIEEDEPKVTFADRVLKSKDNILVRQVAKLASDEGFEIGERRLYNRLREWNMICKNSTEPTQLGVSKGYFVVKCGTIDTPYGIKETRTTLVTPKGQIYIVQRLLKEQNR